MNGIEIPEFHLNGFQDLLRLIATTFRTIYQYIDHVYLIGTFSIFDALISFIIIDIIITALFVTFNVRVGSEESVDRHGDTKIRRKTDI